MPPQFPSIFAFLSGRKASGSLAIHTHCTRISRIFCFAYDFPPFFYIINQWFSTRRWLPISTLGHIWQCLETCLVVTLWGCPWHGGERPGMRPWTSHNAQGPPQPLPQQRTIQRKSSTLSKLINPALDYKCPESRNSYSFYSLMVLNHSFVQIF